MGRSRLRGSVHSGRSQRSWSSTARCRTRRAATPTSGEAGLAAVMPCMKAAAAAAAAASLSAVWQRVALCGGLGQASAATPTSEEAHWQPGCLSDCTQTVRPCNLCLASLLPICAQASDPHQALRRPPPPPAAALDCMCYIVAHPLPGSPTLWATEPLTTRTSLPSACRPASGRWVGPAGAAFVGLLLRQLLQLSRHGCC